MIRLQILLQCDNVSLVDSRFDFLLDDCASRCPCLRNAKSSRLKRGRLNYDIVYFCLCPWTNHAFFSKRLFFPIKCLTQQALRVVRIKNLVKDFARIAVVMALQEKDLRARNSARRRASFSISVHSAKKYRSRGLRERFPLSKTVQPVT